MQPCTKPLGPEADPVGDGYGRGYSRPRRGDPERPETDTTFGELAEQSLEVGAQSPAFLHDRRDEAVPRSDGTGRRRVGR